MTDSQAIHWAGSSTRCPSHHPVGAADGGSSAGAASQHESWPALPARDEEGTVVVVVAVVVATA